MRTLVCVVRFECSVPCSSLALGFRIIVTVGVVLFRSIATFVLRVFFEIAEMCKHSVAYSPSLLRQARKRSLMKGGLNSCLKETRNIIWWKLEKRPALRLVHQSPQTLRPEK